MNMNISQLGSFKWASFIPDGREVFRRDEYCNLYDDVQKISYHRARETVVGSRKEVWWLYLFTMKIYVGQAVCLQY